tara:strand:- start:417603 stop:418442 length:840 start_codon:yes stop_codon:yes gene_type:complete
MRVSYHRGMMKVSFITLLFFVQGAVLFEIFEEKYLLVAFLDVGQGDAIYIQAPNGNDILIDGGAGNDVLRELPSIMDLSDKEIDVVIGTHPDKDHIGGLIPVFDRYVVKNFLDPGVGNDTLIYKELMKRVEKESNYVVARKGMKIYLDKDVIAEVLFPDRDIQGDTNNTSVILKVSYGETDILLTGDASKGVERYLLKQNLESEILKVGHHGSKTSSDPLFLKEVSPLYAIISAGAENRYGHPHASVLSALGQTDAEVLEIAEEGTILFVSDGKTFLRK